MFIDILLTYTILGLAWLAFTAAAHVVDKINNK